MQIALRLFVVGCFAVASIAAIGCGGESEDGDSSSADAHGDDHHGDHGDDHEPETFAEAVAEMEEHYTAIKDADGDTNSSAAHGALHHIVHACEAVGEMAKAGDMSEEQVAAIEEAVGELCDCYTKLDDYAHNKPEGVPYEDLVDRIEAAIATIQSANGEEN